MPHRVTELHPVGRFRFARLCGTYLRDVVEALKRRNGRRHASAIHAVSERNPGCGEQQETSVRSGDKGAGSQRLEIFAEITKASDAEGVLAFELGQRAFPGG